MIGGVTRHMLPHLFGVPHLHVNRPKSLKIYRNKRKRLHKKRVQLPQDCFGTPIWPPFHYSGTPIWPLVTSCELKKKDETDRLVVDFGRLNSVTLKDSYPLPRIDDALDAVNGTKYFSYMDLMNGFWQVEMEP